MKETHTSGLSIEGVLGCWPSLQHPASAGCWAYDTWFNMVPHGFNMVQHGFNMGSTWFNMDATWFHMGSTWFHMGSTWVQHALYVESTVELIRSIVSVSLGEAGEAANRTRAPCQSPPAPLACGVLAPRRNLHHAITPSIDRYGTWLYALES